MTPNPRKLFNRLSVLSFASLAQFPAIGPSHVTDDASHGVSLVWAVISGKSLRQFILQSPWHVSALYDVSWIAIRFITLGTLSTGPLLNSLPLHSNSRLKQQTTNRSFHISHCQSFPFPYVPYVYLVRNALYSMPIPN